MIFDIQNLSLMDYALVTLVMLIFIVILEKEREKLNMNLMIYNLIVLLIFIALAVFFNHWWIIFFALLFLFGYSRKEK